jgi:hypothetical protein
MLTAVVTTRGRPSKVCRPWRRTSGRSLRLRLDFQRVISAPEIRRRVRSRGSHRRCQRLRVQVPAPGIPTQGSRAATPVAAAVELVSDCAQDLTAKTAAIAQKWTSGALTPWTSWLPPTSAAGWRASRGGSRLFGPPVKPQPGRKATTQTGLGFGFDYLAAVQPAEPGR